MGFYNVINAPSMQSGQPEDVSQVLANFQAIAAILNGQLDNSNVATAAAIAYSKLALTGSITNTDISSSAAIAQSKLAPFPVVLLHGTASFAGGTETKLPIVEWADVAGLGTVVSGDWRVDVAGSYVLQPNLYTWNLGGGSNQWVYARLNPAGANPVLSAANANAGIATAGGDRWLAGAWRVAALAVNDVIRLTGNHTEGGARDVSCDLFMIKVA